MKVEDKISRLKREIENLVEERDILLEVSEDYQILSNLSEKLNSLDTEREVIAEILESVSILKDMPAAMFFKNEDGVFRVAQELLYANIKSRLNEEFSGKDHPALERVPKNGRFILLDRGAPAGILGFLPAYQDSQGFRVCYLMPMYVRNEVHGVFVFCSSIEADGAHERTITLFNRLTQTAASRIDNIQMLLDIERLNKKLTERYRERGRRLTESEEKFRNLAEESPNMIFINRGGRVVYANKMCEEKMGYSMEELLSPDFDFRALIAPDSRELVRENMKRHWEGEQIPPYEYKLITKDGREITGIHTTKLIDYEGEKAILGIITDITERKQAEEALRESEERYRSLFENSIEGVALSKGDRAITVNKAVLDMFGYDTVEEFTGIPLLDHVAPESREFILDRIKRRQRGETLDPHFEYKIICKDGTIKDVEATTTGVTINNELYSLGTFRDVTERRRAEIAIQESEKKYRDLADNNLVGVYQTNLKGDILYVNEAMMKIAGLKNPEEMKSINAVMRYKDPKARDRLIKRLQKEGHVDDFEFEALTTSGESKHLMIAASLDGDVISGVMIDITERKKAEVSLQASEEKYRSLIETSADLIFVLDRESGRILEVNDVIYKLLGYTREEVIGTVSGGRVVPEQREEYRRQLERLKKTGRYSGTFEILRKDGKSVYLEVSGSKFGGYLFAIGRDVTDRKRAEDAVRESEERHRLILGNIDEIVYLVQTSEDEPFGGDVQFVSPRSTQILGYGPQQFMDDPGLWFSLIHPEDIPALVESTNRIFKNKEGGVREFRMRCKETGEYMWMEDHVVPRLDDSGRVVGIFGVVRDITERKRAEEQIRMLKEFQERVIDESPVVMEVVDRDLVVTSWNRAAEDYTQVKKEDILGKKFFEVIPSLKKLGWDRIFKRVIETGEPYSVEDYKITRTFGPHKGKTWYQDVNVVPLKEGSKISGAIITVNDITERKMSEEKLEALLDIGQQITRTIDLDSLLEIAVKKISESTDVDRVSIALHDKGKWVVRASYSRIEGKPTFGVTELNLRDFPKMNEAAKKKKTVYVGDSQDPRTQTQIEIAVARKLRIGSGVHVPLIARGKVIGLLNFAAVGKAREFTKKDIEYFETIANALSAMVANAELYEGLKDFSRTLEEKVNERTAELEKARDSLANILEDVTRANKALEEANLKLLEADRLKSVFLASMSHELRTPLNSIIGFTGMVLQGMAGVLNKEQKKQLEIVNSNALHLLKLIEDLLDISKIEADRIDVSPEEFSPAGLIDEVAAGFTPEIRRKGLELKMDVVDATLFTDRRLLKQILLNLIENAVKYTEKGGIGIRARMADDRFIVTVKDTGRGVKKKDLPLIFEPFTRVQTKSGEAGYGSGLGLYISRKIANILGGELGVKSRYNRGSEFSLNLPRARKPEGS